MKRPRPVLMSPSWLILSLAVGFALAAGTAILASISTRNLAASSARIDDRLTQLHQRIEASHEQPLAHPPSVEDLVAAAADQRELSLLAFDSAAVTERAEFFQRISVGLLVAACVLGGAGALLLRRRMGELEDMVTVCAWTKRVRFNGAWVSFEDYLQERFDLQFTHGISEEAAAQLRVETSALAKAEARQLERAQANAA